MSLSFFKKMSLLGCISLSSLGGFAQAQTPQEKLVAARQEGLIVLRGASAILDVLIQANDFGVLNDPMMQIMHQRAIFLTSEWLRAEFTQDRASWRYALGVAKQKIDENIAVNSAIHYQGDSGICADDRFAYAWVSRPDLGVHGCRVLVETKGPRCRIDVINHEFFHVVGVNHGEAGGAPVPADFYQRTMYHALDSADHLSGLATALMSPSSNAVSCNSDGV